MPTAEAAEAQRREGFARVSRNPKAERDHFESLSDQLDAVVGATESATETMT